MRIEELQAAWRLVQSDLAARDTLASELVHFKLPYGPPLLTVDPEKRRHLLIPIPNYLEISEDNKSSGIHVLDQQWGLNGQEQRYVDIICLKPHLDDIFDLIVLDIFDSIKEDPYHPDRGANTTLARWREFIKGVSVSELNTSSAIGLYGELWLLRELSQQNPRAVELWCGPFGERYDFYSGRTALEVKTALQRARKTVSIHGHRQLETPPEGELFLAYLQIEIGPSAAESLTDIVQDLARLNCDMRAFYSALLQIGFTRRTLEDQKSKRFNLLNVEVHSVNDDFPRILPGSFKGDTLPTGIISIDYQLDLTSQVSTILSEDDQKQLFSTLSNEV